jgi:hypothetical protein
MVRRGRRKVACAAVWQHEKAAGQQDGGGVGIAGGYTDLILGWATGRRRVVTRDAGVPDTGRQIDDGTPRIPSTTQQGV